MNLLVIEDDKETLRYLKRAFHDEGFVVDTSEDGLLGSSKAKTNNYDLIILDHALPHKNGGDICREMRLLGKDTPILMLSVTGCVMTKVDILNAGADDYVTKPFAFSELLARTKALLRRPKTLEDQVLELGDIRLDIASHVVEVRNKEVSLTPKEFSLLEYLMRRSGRLVSRMEILEHVWDVNADPFTNTVETHVFNLRKKLQCKNKCQVIHTVSGLGYKMF